MRMNQLLRFFLIHALSTICFLFLTMPLSAAELTLYCEQDQFQFNDREKRKNPFPEVIRELVRRTGTSVELFEAPWKRAYMSAQAGMNAALIPTTRTVEREALFHWIGPVMRLKWVFYKKADTPLIIRSLRDAKRVGSIGTYTADAREQFLLGQGFTNLDSTNRNLLNARKLMEGRIDLLVGTNLGISTIMAQVGHTMNDIKAAYTIKQVDLYIAFCLKTNPKIIERWRTAFADMKQDGTFQTIHSRFFPHEDAPMTPLP